MDLDVTRPLTPEQRASEVGARLFAEKGYAETTTREISRALNITNGTFYHHFRTKQELLRRICEESLARITDEVRAAVATQRSSGARLQALVRTHVRTMLEDQDRHATMLTQLRSLQGDNLAQVVSMRSAYQSLIGSVVVEAQDDGVLRRDVDAHTLLLLLLNLLNWTIFWFRRDGSLTVDGLADEMLAVFLHGASVRP